MPPSGEMRSLSIKLAVHRPLLITECFPLSGSPYRGGDPFVSVPFLPPLSETAVGDLIVWFLSGSTRTKRLGDLP